MTRKRSRPNEFRERSVKTASPTSPPSITTREAEKRSFVLFESHALSKNVGVHLSLGADILPGSTASGIDPKKCILIVVRVIATRVCVAGLGLRYSTIATSVQWRRSGANRVPISSSFTSAAPAFDSDVAGKAVPLGPYSRLLSGRLPQLGPYVTFERGARPIFGHETGGSGHRTAVYLPSSAADSLRSCSGDQTPEEVIGAPLEVGKDPIVIFPPDEL